MKANIQFWSYRFILLRMRNDSDKSCRGNQNTHFVFSNFFFRQLCRLWDTVEKSGTARQATDGNIIRRMRFVWWITKAKDTHSEYVILVCFLLGNRGNIRQQVPLLQEGLQRKEEWRAQLQDWNMECQNFESRRQIGKFEKINAEERGVYSRWQWGAMEKTRWNTKWWLYSVLFRGLTCWKRCSNSGA